MSPPLASSALRGERQHSDTEVNLEAGDALGEVKRTRRRSELRGDVQKHTWKTRERCALDEGAFGGYDCEKHTRRIWR